MSVWVCVPSARPVAEVQSWMLKWKEKGYKVALWRDTGEQFGADLQLHGEYPGYARATNALIRTVLDADPLCDWVVAGGDDVYPDECHSAVQIAGQCSLHFGKLHAGPDAASGVPLSAKSISAALHGIANFTFGVMQPTGDPYGENDAFALAKFPVGRRRYIERICGSPWLGREWCRRGNQGQGPFHPGFWHMHGDECLQEVAEKLGILWQRPDLTHHHQHWARKRGQVADMPAFLAKANTPEHWKESKALLDRLRADGFKECLPLP